MKDYYQYYHIYFIFLLKCVYILSIKSIYLLLYIVMYYYYLAVYCNCFDLYHICLLFFFCIV